MNSSSFDVKYHSYKKLVDENLAAFIANFSSESSGSLNEAVNYVLSMGGKRIRPVLLMLSCEAFGGTKERAIPAALAIEILHNFTLVHDDIMDNASTRRGKTTIHEKWDVNTAILAGDQMIALAYNSLLNTKSPRIADIAKCFTEGVLQVCEGQALDKEFETRDFVSIEDYLLMIKKKTAELVKTSAVIGSIIADAYQEKVELISKFAENLGIAFQIQDDLLDMSADEKEFGKKIGGDIIEKKKTYLYLKALQTCNVEEKSVISELYNTDNADKVDKMFDIYINNGIEESARTEILNYTNSALKYLEGIEESESKNMLKWLANQLLERNS